MNHRYKEQFLNSANDWVCSPYSIDIRYIAIKTEGNIFLLNALITLSPVPPEENLGFSIETEEISAGQIQLLNQSKETLINILTDASDGKININGKTLKLLDSKDLNYYSEMHHKDIWFSPLHLQIIGDQSTSPFFHIDSCNIDHSLRESNPPFDGMIDLTNWLGLKNTIQSNEYTSIVISISPDVSPS